MKDFKINWTMVCIILFGMHAISIASMKPCDIPMFSSPICSRNADLLSSSDQCPCDFTPLKKSAGSK